MKTLRVLCALTMLLPGLAWAGVQNDEISQTIKACGKPLADRVDTNPAAAGGKERLLRYKGIELSFQKVDAQWVFWASSLPSGIANLDRAQTVRNLSCFHDVAGLKGVASAGPVMPKKDYVLAADEQTPHTIDLSAEATGGKTKPVRTVVIAVAASLMALSLLGWIVMKRNAND